MILKLVSNEKSKNKMLLLIYSSMYDQYREEETGASWY